MTTSVSIAGTATYTPKAERVSAQWHHGLNPWFPRGAMDAALIDVTVDEARFWTTLALADGHRPPGQLSNMAG